VSGLCFGAKGKDKMKTITTDELRARMARQSVILFDVRGDSPYEREHILRSLSVPLDQVGERLEGLARQDARFGQKDQPIITYCGGLACSMSERAAEKLEGMGYIDVIDYAEGIAGWKEAGLGTEGAEKTVAVL